MRSGIYMAAVDALGAGEIDLVRDDIRAVIIALGYKPDFARHRRLIDIPEALRLATSAPLTGTRWAGGRFHADEEIFPAVQGPEAGGVLLIAGELIATRAIPIALLDKSCLDGFPFMPDGGDVTVRWPKTGIFSIGGRE